MAEEFRGIGRAHEFHTNVGTSVLCHPILRGLGGRCPRITADVNALDQ